MSGLRVETVSDVTVTCVLQKQTSLCDGSAWPEKSRVLKALTRNDQQDAGTNDNPRLHTHLQFPPKLQPLPLLLSASS